MFTVVDAVVAVVLLGSAGMAFLRGFVHEVLAIAAWLGAGAVALYGFPFVQPWFAHQIALSWAADVSAGLALFLGSLLIFSLVTRAVSNRVKASALGSVDSSLGFLFGLLRGAVLLCLAWLVVGWAVAPDEPPAWMANAKTRPWLERGAVVLKTLRPAPLGKVLREADTGDAPAADGGNSLTLAPAAAPVRAATGYDQQQRHEMDRLFQTNQ